MVNYRLDLHNEQGSPTQYLINCPINEAIPVSVNFQINDIRYPDKGIGTMSKTIQIPGTKEVDDFFELVHDVNISLNKFNPNLKIRAYYYTNELLQVNGYLQIVDILINEITRKVVYECQIVGEVVSLFAKIKDLYLTALDFSAYNHTLNYTNVTNSFSVTPGAGVAYGLVDRGQNNSNLSIVKLTEMTPVLFKREILLKIFQAQGMTWTSSILDSAAFKKETILGSKIPALSAAQVNNGKFYATADGTQTPFPTTYFINPYGNTVPFGSQNINIAEFPTEVYDTGGIYNNAGFVFTVPVTNKYNIQGSLGLKFQITRDVGAGPIDVSANMSCVANSGIHIFVYNSTTATITGVFDLDVNGGTFGFSGQQFSVTTILNNIQLTAGDLYYIGIKCASVPLQYTAATPGATWVLNTQVVSGSSFSAEFASNELYEGTTVNCNDLLPENVKQSDFLTDIRKEFNLMFLQDKSNPNNIFIETWKDFYNGTVQNWDGKHDRNSGVKVIPMSDLDFNQLNCAYIDDGDFYNKKHQDEYKNTYGYYQKDITNDFVKGTRDIKTTAIANTPYAWNPATGLVVPTIISMDATKVTPFKNKARSLYWSGLITPPVGISWKLSYNNGASLAPYNQIPHLGHTDNPWNPTIDLGWGVPKKIYFTWPNQFWTTNNRYNRYYYKQILEVTDKQSKLYITRFYLNCKDISEFDFRQPIFTTINREQGIFIVNRILDYDPKTSDTVLVELMKLISYNDHSPITVALGDGPDTKDSSWSQMKMNNIVNSPNSINYGNDSMITGGNSNMIALNSQATLTNCENVIVLGNVVNFTGIGLKNKTIDSTQSNRMLTEKSESGFAKELMSL